MSVQEQVAVMPPGGQEAWALGELGKDRAVPVFRELPADLETPVSVYLKLRGGAASFLLESVEGGDQLGRYSFIGAEPRAMLRFRDGRASLRPREGPVEEHSYGDPLELIARAVHALAVTPNPELPRFQGGAVGFLGYEAAACFERLPVPAPDTVGAPDGMFMYCDELAVFDHVRQVISIVSLAVPHPDGPAAAYHAAEQRLGRLARRIAGAVPDLEPPAGSNGASEVSASVSQAEFEQLVERAKAYIRAGDIIQVVPSLRLSRPLPVPAFDVYRALRRVNPSPYMYFLDLGEMQIAGASPEMLVQCVAGVVRTRPLAGTRPRGGSQAEDRKLAQDLLADPKERAEHVMLLDLGRNDIGRIASPGSVSVDNLMSIERFSHVMHIVSDVSGALRGGLRGVDALRACFPAGTLTGAPKIRAMEIIAELENLRRGPYGGAVGYLSYSGDLDTAIAIRTMVARDGVAHVQAGAGIVADSVPSTEYQECLNKARAVMHAIELAEEGRDAARAG